MSKWQKITGAAVLLVAVFSFGCIEEPVGAPCFPETEDGTWLDQAGDSYAIETRSVQCKTSGAKACITKTNSSNANVEDAAKYSFCSCKCGNIDGGSADKAEDLCDCPPNTECATVDFPVNDTPSKILGNYCIPKCVLNGCDIDDQKCMPSNDGDEPWNWKCTY